ncbi:MAG: glutamate-1-semialdehyde 2,1-aminomutase [Gammaproteobacteria bacterium]|nr:glutamate-1-semialdehyde 2,1-aminomutase [Gammaproteobacteria bacterium]
MTDGPSGPGPTRYPKSRLLREEAHRLIPGGCHTNAKGDDQFPEEAPGFIARGLGSHVWDLDGNEFIEYGMGLRSVTLGHAYPAVIEAVAAELPNGSNFNRPSPLEVACARRFLECIPNHDCVKFTKDGSAATSAAIKLARAHTGRDKVAICLDQPFFSSEDWFIGTTPVNAGIPRAIRNLTVGFRYNDLASLEALFAAQPGEIAAVILEPARNDEPLPGFLPGVQELCRRHGALLVLDEMITGFRWHLAGAQHVYGITPDLSTFGKALANGFALSALTGRRDIMELGGLTHDRERVFLLSTTHGAETHGLAAGIATMGEYQAKPVIETLYARGDQLREGVARHIHDLKLADRFSLSGRACSLQFNTLGPDGRPSQEFRTLFLQELLARHILAPSFVVSYSHSTADIDATIAATGEALQVYRAALADGIARYLRGRPVQPVYRRYNRS